MDAGFINTSIGILATGVIVSNIILIFLLICFGITWFSKKRISFISSVEEFVIENSLGLAFLISVAAMLGSLFLSEIAKFNPCELCWYQRICMYPQVLILGIGFFYNDKTVKRISIPLAVIGALVAIYHFFLQMFPMYLPCSDRTANCALIQFRYYGYVTIPVMSLSAFLLIIVILSLKFKKKNSK